MGGGDSLIIEISWDVCMHIFVTSQNVKPILVQYGNTTQVSMWKSETSSTQKRVLWVRAVGEGL